jgi:hypothetical protein
MEVTFGSKGDFDNVQEWLNKVAKNSPNDALNKIAKEGEQSLAANTPKDTGVTAAGWESEITTEGKGIFEVVWTNTAHPETSVNVAVIIDQGHGTGTGGYVQPRPYIKRAMDSVFANAGDEIEKELIK